MANPGELARLTPAFLAEPQQSPAAHADLEHLPEYDQRATVANAARSTPGSRLKALSNFGLERTVDCEEFREFTDRLAAHTGIKTFTPIDSPVAPITSRKRVQRVARRPSNLTAQGLTLAFQRRTNDLDTASYTGQSEWYSPSISTGGYISLRVLCPELMADRQHFNAMLADITGIRKSRFVHDENAIMIGRLSADEYSADPQGISELLRSLAPGGPVTLDFSGLRLKGSRIPL